VKTIHFYTLNIITLNNKNKVFFKKLPILDRKIYMFNKHKNAFLNAFKEILIFVIL